MLPTKRQDAKMPPTLDTRTAAGVAGRSAHANGPSGDESARHSTGNTVCVARVAN
jgi:hypothetical protein